jgi:hypothetical protein
MNKEIFNLLFVVDKILVFNRYSQIESNTKCGAKLENLEYRKINKSEKTNNPIFESLGGKILYRKIIYRLLQLSVCFSSSVELVNSVRTNELTNLRTNLRITEFRNSAEQCPSVSVS